MLWYTYIFCFFRHFSYLLIICEKIQLFPEVSLLLTAEVQHKDLTGSVIGLAAITSPPLDTRWLPQCRQHHRGYFRNRAVRARVV
jgi:hypothetical protein